MQISKVTFPNICVHDTLDITNKRKAMKYFISYS